MTATVPRRVTGPSPEQVVLLQSVRDEPCVSLLATTTPAPRMTDADARTLQRLAGEAGARLARDGAPAELTTALEDLVAAARTEPTGAGIALYVNRALRQVVRLPVPVPDRVVVDPTFATRDLVRALHRIPRHVVLLLSEQDARLLEGGAGTLRPPRRSPFPLRAEDDAGDAFLRRVDRALGTFLRLHPAPLVLVGGHRVVGRFRRLSRNTGRLAGTVTGNLTRAPLSVLVPRVREVLDGYLLSRQDEALAHLDRRRSRSAVVEGIDAAWLAARRERPEMLAVEEGFTLAARLSADGDFLVPADDVEHPDVVDDVVDELIETVLLRGGWIAFVADGALADAGRVALALR
ncbi:baeRF3 domain-containing protein [Geodermatophilus sp. SYSU D00710]